MCNGQETRGITRDAIRFDAKSMIETRHTILPGDQEGEFDDLSLSIAGVERVEEVIRNAQWRLGHGLGIALDDTLFLRKKRRVFIVQEGAQLCFGNI